MLCAIDFGRAGVSGIRTCRQPSVTTSMLDCLGRVVVTQPNGKGMSTPDF